MDKAMQSRRTHCANNIFEGRWKCELAQSRDLRKNRDERAASAGIADQRMDSMGMPKRRYLQSKVFEDWRFRFGGRDVVAGAKGAAYQSRFYGFRSYGAAGCACENRTAALALVL